jgi:hypothetical protein
MTWLMLFSGGSFLIYGISCLMSAHMREEFSRFGLARFRMLVGWLEVTGGLAQIAFIVAPQLAAIATAGLFVLMLMGVITRIRIGDSLWVTLPALGYLALNGWLLFALALK